MGANERLYILKTVDGEEYGPVDQECLVRWAENGRITAYCQIRSTLIARWESACEVPFLRSILLKQVEEKDTRNASLFSRIRTLATRRAVQVVEISGLHEVRPEDFEAARMHIRAAAALLDLAVVVLSGVATYLVFALLFSARVLGPNGAFYLGLMVFYLSAVMYYAYNMGFSGQTVGQRFWGIILIRKNGEEFYLGRAFTYTIGMFCFGLLTPFVAFVAPSGRSLQEIVTGTRMVRVKLIGKRR
ncbi:MAG: RDD family protein [Lentisphaeria bacterium]|nr:RDD family protein [Lentisphaeria bacterium]